MPSDRKVTLYHSPNTRSTGALILLEELGEKYEREDYGRQFGNTTTPDYLKLNPNAKVPTIQGTVSFDENGDLADRTVSVFQIKKDTTKPLTDVSAQYKYIDVAPQS